MMLVTSHGQAAPEKEREAKKETKGKVKVPGFETKEGSTGRDRKIKSVTP